MFLLSRTVHFYFFARDSALHVHNSMLTTDFERNTKHRFRLVFLISVFRENIDGCLQRDFYWQIHLSAELLPTAANSCSALLRPFAQIISRRIVVILLYTEVSLFALWYRFLALGIIVNVYFKCVKTETVLKRIILYFTYTSNCKTEFCEMYERISDARKRSVPDAV
jgi:hypothetical protein